MHTINFIRCGTIAVTLALYGCQATPQGDLTKGGKAGELTSGAMSAHSPPAIGHLLRNGVEQRDGRYFAWYTQPGKPQVAAEIAVYSAATISGRPFTIESCRSIFADVEKELVAEYRNVWVRESGDVNSWPLAFRLLLEVEQDAVETGSSPATPTVPFSIELQLTCNAPGATEAIYLPDLYLKEWSPSDVQVAEYRLIYERATDVSALRDELFPVTPW